MPRKAKFIPVNTMTANFGAGIAIEKIFFKDLKDSYTADLNDFEAGRLAHREDKHSFYLLESGTVWIEIDFQKHIIAGPSIIYMHPDQVHRVLSLENATISSWAIDNENLNPEYLKLLEEITPAPPLVLIEETLSILLDAVSITLKFADRKSDKLYLSSTRDSCNALVALVISQYLGSAKISDKSSRFEAVTKTFKALLERNYTKLKSPSAYAQKINISTPYLNECVKNTTGYSVSYHIHQRIILEAKRLLYYSDKSVKEIAAALGYDDHPYFSRLFIKITGVSALTFRKKNLD